MSIDLTDAEFMELLPECLPKTYFQTNWVSLNMARKLKVKTFKLHGFEQVIV